MKINIHNSHILYICQSQGWGHSTLLVNPCTLVYIQHIKPFYIPAAYLMPCSLIAVYHWFGPLAKTTSPDSSQDLVNTGILFLFAFLAHPRYSNKQTNNQTYWRHRRMNAVRASEYTHTYGAFSFKRKRQPRAWGTSSKSDSGINEFVWIDICIFRLLCRFLRTINVDHFRCTKGMLGEGGNNKKSYIICFYTNSVFEQNASNMPLLQVVHRYEQPRISPYPIVIRISWDLKISDYPD